jgi:hypothetical protein
MRPAYRTARKDRMIVNHAVRSSPLSLAAVETHASRIARSIVRINSKYFIGSNGEGGSVAVARRPARSPPATRATRQRQQRVSKQAAVRPARHPGWLVVCPSWLLFLTPHYGLSVQCGQVPVCPLFRCPLLARKRGIEYVSEPAPRDVRVGFNNRQGEVLRLW